MIGVDLVSIKRINKLVEKYESRFLKKILNESEIELVINENGFNINRIAGFFCAKEALSKALKCGICSDLNFLDIVISLSKFGAPCITLSPKAKAKFGIQYFDISITHDGEYAISIVKIRNIGIYYYHLVKKLTKNDLEFILNLPTYVLDEILMLDLKSPKFGLFLSLCLGLFGVDRFYIRDYKKGILKLLFCFTLIFWIVDLFVISRDIKKRNFTFIRSFESRQKSI